MLLLKVLLFIFWIVIGGFYYVPIINSKQFLIEFSYHKEEEIDEAYTII